MTTTYRVSREKKKTFSRPLIKNVITQNNNSCFKRPLTVKQLQACSTEQLLVFNNLPVLLRAPGKRPQETTTPNSLGNCILLDTPPSELALTLRGGGYGYVLKLPIQKYSVGRQGCNMTQSFCCLLYTSDAADE